MANPLRYLNVQLRLLADDYNNKIKAAQKEAKAFEKTIRPSKELLGDIGKAATIAGTAILAGMAVAVKATADYGDAINDAAKRTGLTTEALSKLKLAADTSGTSFDGLQTGLKFLAKNMEAATAGGKEQIAAFKAAGISSKDLAAAHGDVNQILFKLSDTFAGAQDGAGKTALSMKLLGKSGTELIPLLNEGSAGLKKWGDEAERMGRVVSQEAAVAADEFNDQLTLLEGSVTGLGGAVGTALIPPLTDLIKKTTDVVSGLQKWVAINPGLTKGIAAAAAVLTGAGGLLVGMSGLLTILPKLQTAWAVMAQAITLVNVALVGALTAVIYFRREISEVLLSALSGALSGVRAFINGAAALASKLGADGLSARLRDAADSAGIWAKAAEIGSTSLMKESMIIDATAKQLTAVTVATGKHTLSLGANSEALDKAKKSAEEYSDFWKKELRDFRNQTFQGGQEVKEGLDAADKAVRVIIADYKDLLKAEQDAGDALIVNQGYWEKQLQLFRDGAQSVKDDVRAGEEAADHSAQVIIENHKKVVKAGEDQAKKWREVWTNAMGNVVSGFAKGVSDMIFHAKSFSESLKGIFKQLAETIVQTMVTSAFTKIANGLSNLIFGGKSGGGLGSLLGGGGSAGGLSGIAKGIGGALGLGGLFAGGAAAATPAVATIGTATVLTGGALTAPAVAAPALAGGIGAGGGLGATIAGLASNPVTIAAAAAIAAGIAIHHFVGRGRRTANEFVQGTENPFGANLKGLVDSFDIAKKAGTLTLADAEASRDALMQLWASFKESANDFASQGKNQAKVAKQSMDHFAQIFGPDLAVVFAGFQATIDKLKKGESTAEADNGGGFSAAATSFNAAASTFSAAVDRFASTPSTQNIYNIDITLNSNDPDDRRLIARMREWGRNNTRGFAQDIAALARNNRQGVVTSAG